MYMTITVLNLYLLPLSKGTIPTWTAANLTVTGKHTHSSGDCPKPQETVDRRLHNHKREVITLIPAALSISAGWELWVGFGAWMAVLAYAKDAVC